MLEFSIGNNVVADRKTTNREAKEEKKSRKE
jgi:hypothetical protein